MDYTIWQVLWIFLVYSFLGWILETVTAAIRRRQFVNRGFINGPVCILYGIAAVFISVGLSELTGFWLFLGSVIVATVTEWIAGHLIERFWHERWWDYSDRSFNLDGYVCLAASLLWGVLGYVMVTWGNRLIFVPLMLLPSLVAKILILIAVGILAVDITATIVLLSNLVKKRERWEMADAWLIQISSRLGRWIYRHIDRRIQKAYPHTKKAEISSKNKEIFGYGCSFYKIVTLFFIGAFLGDLTETLFCRLTMGIWMSRSSVVWGPFSIVWGLAIAAVTALLYKYKDRSDRFLFLTGTFLGGAYEYLCSVFTEIVFGTVFWDYSAIPLNLGGRINLLYCFFWGIAAVVWFKLLYPHFSALIEKIPRKIGVPVIWILIVFMLVNMSVSTLALSRYDARTRGIPAANELEQMLDTRFDDARMNRIYPNAKQVEESD